MGYRLIPAPRKLGKTFIYSSTGSDETISVLFVFFFNFRIPYNAASSATPNKRIFRLVFLTDAGEQDEIEIKLVRPRIAIALYRSITEKHAFYSCETVGTDVTKQFIRDFRVNI